MNWTNNALSHLSIKIEDLPNPSQQSPNRHV